jgi:hypothetical protein
MERTTTMIKVILRTDKEGQVTALFPELPGTRFWLQDCLCYAHVGQHESASFNWYETTRPATPDEYKDLLTELQGIYDGQLKPVSRMTRQDEQKRREAVENVRQL